MRLEIYRESFRRRGLQLHYRSAICVRFQRDGRLRPMFIMEILFQRSGMQQASTGGWEDTAGVSGG